MGTREHPATVAAAPRRWALNTFRVIAFLTTLLILLQALLAGEWLAGNDVIDIHKLNGVVLCLLGLLQLVIVAMIGLERRPRRMALSVTSLFLVLVVAQLLLGFAGFDSANQARAFHITNGVLLFGLAAFNALLAQRTMREAR